MQIKMRWLTLFASIFMAVYAAVTGTEYFDIVNRVTGYCVEKNGENLVLRKCTHVNEQQWYWSGQNIMSRIGRNLGLCLQMQDFFDHNDELAMIGFGRITVGNVNQGSLCKWKTQGGEYLQSLWQPLKYDVRVVTYKESEDLQRTTLACENCLIGGKAYKNMNKIDRVTGLFSFPHESLTYKIKHVRSGKCIGIWKGNPIVHGCADTPIQLWYWDGENLMSRAYKNQALYLDSTDYFYQQGMQKIHAIGKILLGPVNRNKNEYKWVLKDKQLISKYGQSYGIHAIAYTGRSGRRSRSESCPGYCYLGGKSALSLGSSTGKRELFNWQWKFIEYDQNLG